MAHNFGEKKEEMGLPVWQSPKYVQAKAKAIEIIESGKYGLSDSDFWILMNKTKTDKMAYTGLILSHNGCLKINETLESKFDPSCLSIDKDGYWDSLVYTYCSPEQGIYEVGEVSKKNLPTNAYPYAMALKRCFDRVVLKLSKLAYDNILSDSESEEFREDLDVTKEKADAKKEVDKAVEEGREERIANKISTLASIRGCEEQKIKDCLVDIATLEEQETQLDEWLMKANKKTEPPKEYKRK